MIIQILVIIAIILFSPSIGYIDRQNTTEPPVIQKITPKVTINTPPPQITTSQPKQPQVEPIVPQPVQVIIEAPSREVMMHDLCDQLYLYWYDNDCYVNPKVIINNEEQTMPTKITSEVLPEPVPVVSAVIEVVDVLPGKGLSRTHYAYDWDTFNNNNVPDSERPVGFVFPDESSSIDIGIIVRNNKGQSMKDAILKITATDASQNKTIDGTGITKKMRDAEGNVSEIASYYPYHYEFKTTGKHTLTFESSKVSLSIDIEVLEK